MGEVPLHGAMGSISSRQTILAPNYGAMGSRVVAVSKTSQGEEAPDRILIIKNRSGVGLLQGDEPSGQSDGA